MAGITVTLTGADELQRLLAKIAANGPAVLNAALESGANVIRNEAKQRCPYQSGTLRRSIVSKQLRQTAGENTWAVVAQEPYGLYVEFGTGIYAEGGNGRQSSWRYQRNDGSWITTRGSRPQPFMRPAFQAKEGEALQEIKDAIAALVANP